MEENQTNGLNLFEHTNPTNKDINVVFTPDSSIIRYEYRIAKDDELSEYIEINNNHPSTIFLTQTGIYKIEIRTFDSFNNIGIIESGIYNIDKDKPVIEVNESSINMQIGSKLEVMEGIRVYDKQDGDLLSEVTSNYNELDFTTTGLKKLIYTVEDQAGNTTTATVQINVTKNYSNSLFVIQSAIIAMLLVLIVIIIIYRRSMNLERRIGKYSIQSIKGNGLSPFDSILTFYKKLINMLNKNLSTSIFLKKYSRRYEKYVNAIDRIHTSGMDFVCSKVIVSFVFLLVAVFSKTIQYEILSIYEIFFPIVLGFFVPDIIYISKYRMYRNKIENDLLQAIIIMNNAFKSGRSITQAVELVTKELDGPIAEEFKKMHLEITFGLAIDVVFKRFSERINLEEVTYLTASLTILNKTGGNIIKVFSSIEKSLFNKKKLKLELQSLTGSSKMIVYVLSLIPILFVGLVSIINPSYFVPFYTTTVGFILTGMMLLIYMTYIFFVRKIMKVRM
jgi:tight adherence protein B